MRLDLIVLGVQQILIISDAGVYKYVIMLININAHMCGGEELKAATP